LFPGFKKTVGGMTTSLAPKKVLPQPPPKKSGAFDVKHEKRESQFRVFYDRGDLPLCVDFAGATRKIAWKVDIEKLDYHHYLPIFFDGLRELEEPYSFLAMEGTKHLLAKGGARILPVVPQLIIPIKIALNSKDPPILCQMLLLLQQLVQSAEMVGEALVPYYRQILPVFNLFREFNTNIGDAIDYGQQRNRNLGDLIEQTLALFEQHGGDDAFINIKYMVPTYESHVLN